MNASDPNFDWGVFHQLRSGRQRLHRLRLVIREVPPTIRRAELTAKIEEAGLLPHVSDAGVAWANHTLLREDRWPAVIDAADGSVRQFSWPQLEQLTTGTLRRLTLPLAPAEYSAAVMAARAAGASLRAWCREQLVQASGVGR